MSSLNPGHKRYCIYYAVKYPERMGYVVEPRCTCGAFYPKASRQRQRGETKCNTDT